MTRAPIRLDLTVQEGASWSQTYTHRGADGLPVDLTGWSADFVVGYQRGADMPHSILIAASYVAPIITLANDGLVTMTLAPLDTWRGLFASNQINDRPDQYFYNLDLTDPAGTVFRPLQGRLIFYRSASLWPL